MAIHFVLLCGKCGLPVRTAKSGPYYEHADNNAHDHMPMNVVSYKVEKVS